MPSNPSLIGSEIVRITYGVDVNDAQDPYIKLSELAMYAAKRTAIPGSYLVDIIPVCTFSAIYSTLSVS